MCATRKGMKRGLGGVYMQCCTLQCIHVPMPSWSYAQLCNWALIKFQLLKVKILFTSITDICFSRIKRQCRSPVMSSTSKMVFFLSFQLSLGEVSMSPLCLLVWQTWYLSKFILPDFQAKKFAAYSRLVEGGEGTPWIRHFFFTIKISAKVGEG